MEGLDYGAPEDGGAQSAHSGIMGAYPMPDAIPRVPEYGASDPSDALVSAAQVAPQSPDEDFTPVPDQPDVAVAQSIGLPRVRLNVLHVFGAPVTQMSTSRLFAWLVECGASPLSIEWVNDFSCNVVFHDARAALRGLRNLMLEPTPEDRARAEAAAQREQEEQFTFGAPDLDADGKPAAVELPDDLITGVALPTEADMEALLQHTRPLPKGDKAGDDELPEAEAEAAPGEAGDLSQFDGLGVSLLTSRKLRPVPLKIYVPKERELAKRLLKQRQEAQREQEAQARAGANDGEGMAVDDADDVRREASTLPPPPATLPRKPDFDFDDLLKLTSTLYARFSVAELDQKQRGSRDQSDWYRIHGMEAGRQVVPLLQIGAKAKRAQIEARELLDLPVLEQRMRAAATRERSLSPGRGQGAPDGIQIRGRGTISAPDDSRPGPESVGQIRGRGRGSRRAALQGDAILESDKIERSQRFGGGDQDELLPSESKQNTKLTDRLTSATPLETRIAGPSLLDRLGAAPTPSSGSGSGSGRRRRERW